MPGSSLVPCGRDEPGMRVIWTPEALQDRTDVWDYIAADNPQAAARMDALLSDAAGRPSETRATGNDSPNP